MAVWCCFLDLDCSCSAPAPNRCHSPVPFFVFTFVFVMLCACFPVSRSHLQTCCSNRAVVPALQLRSQRGEDRGEDEGPAGAGAQRQQGTVNRKLTQLHILYTLWETISRERGLGFWLLGDEMMLAIKGSPQSLTRGRGEFLCRGKRGGLNNGEDSS